MRFAHISDLHLSVNVDDFSLLRSDLVETIKFVVDDIKSIEKHLDFVAITGDLTQIGDLESYKKLKELLEKLEIPVFLVPGNHDEPRALGEVFNRGKTKQMQDFKDYCIDFNGIQLLGVNTRCYGKDHGKLSNVQLSWIEEKLSNQAFSRNIIFMHHSPFLTGFSGYDETIQLLGRDAFGNSIEKSHSQIIILSGHIHKPFQAVWRGANCYIAGGPCFQLGSAAPFGEGEQEVLNEPYCYFVHSILEDNSHVVSTRYVNLDNHNY
ncbi:MAG: 3',5'-cyclic AMP phosphodiesterase CpdA [Bermanella sp.]|jgi:3',5'-cyclic AMP phosphodiesterase CpdA